MDAERFYTWLAFPIAFGHTRYNRTVIMKTSVGPTTAIRPGTNVSSLDSQADNSSSDKVSGFDLVNKHTTPAC